MDKYEDNNWSSYKLNRLKQYNLISMIEKKSITMIATEFKIDAYLVKEELSKQFKFNLLNCSEDFIEEVDISKGAWQELKESEIYKQTINKQ